MVFCVILTQIWGSDYRLSYGKKKRIKRPYSEAIEFHLSIYCLLESEVEDNKNRRGRSPGPESWVSFVQLGDFRQIIYTFWVMGFSFTNKKGMNLFFHNLNNMDNIISAICLVKPSASSKCAVCISVIAMMMVMVLVMVIWLLTVNTGTVVIHLSVVPDSLWPRGL